MDYGATLPLGASLDADPLNKQSSALAHPPSQTFVPIPLPALTHRNSLFSSKGVTWLQYSPDRLLQESLPNTPCRPIDVQYLPESLLHNVSRAASDDCGSL